MPDSGIADGTVYTSSFHDSYVRQQVITTCTSGTRPTGTEGRFIYETDTDRLKYYDGAAWQTALQLGASSRVGGSWTRVATQTISISVTTDVLWDTEGYDSDGFLTPSASTATVPSGSGGIYVATAKIVWSADSTPARMALVWSLGGVTYYDMTEIGSSAMPVGFQQGISGMAVMAAADTVKCEIRHASAASKTITGRFDLYRLAN